MRRTGTGEVVEREGGRSWRSRKIVEEKEEGIKRRRSMSRRIWNRSRRRES